LRKLFRDLFLREAYKYDAMFDWTVIKCKEDNKPADKSDDVMEVDKDKDKEPTRLQRSGSDRRVDSSEDSGEKRGSTKLVERKSATRRATIEAEPSKASSFIRLKKKEEPAANGKPQNGKNEATQAEVSKSNSSNKVKVLLTKTATKLNK